MYTTKTENAFEKDVNKLDNGMKTRVYKWVTKNLVNCSNPRLDGKALDGALKGYWRYRIGEYRLIVLIDDKNKIIRLYDVLHRSVVYKRFNKKAKSLTKEELIRIIEELRAEDDFTEEEDLYDLEVMHQYMKDKEVGKIKTYPIEKKYKELGIL